MTDEGIKKTRVLIVDDEDLVRRALSRVFSLKGCEVVEAQDGVEGLAKWKAHPVDLVFLDVVMPGLTGPQVLSEMGSNRTGKVVLMSAFSGNITLELDKTLVDLFVPKPFDDIFLVVEEALKMVNKSFNENHSR